MNAEQQHKKLLIAFRIKGALQQIKPLATPSVLRIKDADGKRALHWAVEHHDDIKVIKLMISPIQRRSPLLLAVSLFGSGSTTCPPRSASAITTRSSTCWAPATTR